ncbi:tetratricopeptide repeat protein [Aequorivita lipolytica]|uniref:Tetratricopeptide repeat protein n=1 Tax=Aequorivita lipolytica TaxID=153267 RepID=A0A5C6YR28_9FLAO|nr:hypothetical protein [Aequorivita lipolytica]TXD69829.1 hypothetical protein ESV24_05150 [Aequorivita lipolytica]SRX50359.1 hypothetical protein AEQU2_00831 [Aequorivita lipolytica]
MLGGFGSINHMIVTLRNNKNLLPAKRSYFKNRNYSSIKNEYYNAVGDSFNIKKASGKQLLEVRYKIRLKRKRETRNFILLLSLGLPLICFTLYFTFNNFSFGFPKMEQVAPLDIEKNNKEKYLFYLSDGDAWLEKRDWYNAIFQYKNAVKLYPNDFGANYRLALGYAYRCQYEFEDCAVGKKLIDKLEKQFPENIDVKAVKAIFLH